MGYDIRPISEINTIDKKLCAGYPIVDLTKCVSLDGQFFIVEGEGFNAYTHSEILEVLKGANWTEQTI